MVLGTLVIQGLTLKPLMARLDLEHDDSVEREVQLAWVETLRPGRGAGRRRTAATRRRSCGSSTSPTHAGRERDTPGREPEDTGRPPVELAAAALNATRAERRRLLELRDRGTIGDDAFHQVEEELDRAELNALMIDPDG